MSIDLEASGATRRRPLGVAGTLAGLGVIGGVLLVVGGGFAYLGGWLTPGDVTPARFTDAFQQVNGVHPGFRRNHAKGIGVSGFFESNGNGLRVSKAVVFQSGRTPVLGRFSLSGGQPYAADAASDVRGLGLQFNLPDGELWRTAMVNVPRFPFRTPEAFYEQLLASKPDPATGKPDPAALKAFIDRHPETAQVLGFSQAAADPLRVRQPPLPRPHLLLVRGCFRTGHAGPLDPDPAAAVRAGPGKHNGPGQELPVRRSDRPDAQAAAALAAG